MKKIVVCISLILIMILGGCCNQQIRLERNNHDIVENIRSSTVALVAKTETGNLATYCTAVWISNNKMITAEHCTTMIIDQMIGEIFHDDKNKKILVKAIQKDFEISYTTFNEGSELYDEMFDRVYKIYVDKIDIDHDLATLVVDETMSQIPEHSYVTIGNESPEVGDEIHMIGHPSGLLWTYNRGYVSANRGVGFLSPAKIGPWLQVSIPGWRGNSGCGAFNSQGELVGIASFMIDGVPNSIVFIHIDTINDFLWDQL